MIDGAMFRYKNNVSGLNSNEAPPSFQGGLLADDMGLGKTLSMISLIAYNQAKGSLPSLPITPEPLDSIPPLHVKATLLIVPPARKCYYVSISAARPC